ncbi:MAG: GntR family transcriptional regulator [Spirochaetaceae bacterium]|nr:GntR family transcriptional regulator [Spirochaetaceae bacterium]
MEPRGNKKVWVYENLKRRIISVELVPGSPIIEAEFAEALGVSKTPIREALRQLERDGFVVNVPSRGSMISHITTQEIHDVFQIREIIEAGAAKRAAQGGANQEIAKLRAGNDELLEDLDSIEEYVHEWGTWEDIHAAVVRSLGNVGLEEVYQGLLDRILRIRNHYGKRLTRRRYHDIIVEHNAIADAILRGDGDAAEMAMQQHLRNASQFLMGISVPYDA